MKQLTTGMVQRNEHAVVPSRSFRAEEQSSSVLKKAAETPKRDESVRICGSGDNSNSSNDNSKNKIEVLEYANAKMLIKAQRKRAKVSRARERYNKMKSYFKQEVHEVLPTVAVRRSRKALLAEFFLYLGFLILFCLNTFSERPGIDTFYFTRSVRTMFADTEFLWEDSQIEKTFMSIATQPDFWNWLRGPTMVELFSNGLETKALGGSNSLLLANNRSVLLSGLRLRQFRVVHTDCTFDSRIAMRIPEGTSCSKAFSAATESKAAFGANGRFTYSEAQELDANSVSGRVSDYPAGGFVVNVPLNMSYLEATAFVNELFEDNFIDVYTRAVVLEGVTFSPTLQIYSFVTQLVEFPLGGGALPSTNYRTLSLKRYIDPDLFWLTMEILFMAYIVFYT